MTDDFLDLKGHMRWEIWGVHRGIGHPNEVIKHHAPLTAANAKEHAINRFIFKRAVYSKEFQTLRGAFCRRVFRGEGATPNFRVILN